MPELCQPFNGFTGLSKESDITSTHSIVRLQGLVYQLDDKLALRDRQKRLIISVFKAYVSASPNKAL